MSSLGRGLAFTAGALLLHGLLSVLFVATIGAAHDARRMDARWLEGPQPVQVMVAGDSHARFAVEASVLGSAINVAVPGEHYLKTLYRLPWLLQHGTRTTQAVLLPFDAASFSSFKADNFQPEVVWGRYVDFFELGRHKGARFSYAGRWAKGRLAPYTGELGSVLQFLTHTKHFRDEQNPSASLGLTFLEGGPRAARRHLQGADPWDPDMAWALRRILALCREAELRVVLVRYPVTRSYAQESRRLGADPALRDALLAEIRQDGVVDHLDFEAVFFDEPRMFSDGDHLNPTGRRWLSRLLARSLQQLGVLTPRG